MSASQQFERVFRMLMPGPFGLALLLTAVAALLSLSIGGHSLIELSKHWQRGFWDPSMMVFTLQMALILILGYSVAVSPPITLLIARATLLLRNQSQALVTLCLLSMLLCWVNWGLGLIVGAIVARKIAEDFQKRNIAFYYPLLGAAGYSGMMTWHSGISGSAPLKAAENNHLIELSGIADAPVYIPLRDTVLSLSNLTLFVLLLFLVPLTLLIFRKRQSNEEPLAPFKSEQHAQGKTSGAERFENTRLPALLTGLALAAATITNSITSNEGFGPNTLNAIFLSFALVTYGSLSHFLKSIRAGMDGAASIIIQFPFYFGIMGILRYGGLIDSLTTWFTNVGSDNGIMLSIMGSAGLVNFFVPSGGGQWAVQGPLIISICDAANIPLQKGIMTMAYGDQLTNMLQPFWALPLLAITGLKAHRVLPYTFLIMLVGALVYTIALLVT